MKRSNDQNEYYWGVVVVEAMEFYSQNPVKLAELFFKFVKAEFLSKEFMHETFKIVFNNGKTTQFKDTEEKRGTELMIEYIDRIREHFLFEYKVDIPPPHLPKIEFIQ